MYLSSLYRRGVTSSQTKTCCLPSMFLSSRLLVRNSFLFLYDTNLAMIGRGFSLFLLFCPSRCTLCISLWSKAHHEDLLKCFIQWSSHYRTHGRNQLIFSWGGKMVVTCCRLPNAKHVFENFGCYYLHAAFHNAICRSKWLPCGHMAWAINDDNPRRWSEAATNSCKIYR